jgi:type IV pilus assembly protein PilO
MDKKTQQNLVILALCFAVGIFVYYKLLIAPLDTKYSKALDNLQAAQSRLADMKHRAMELPKLQNEMKLLESEVTELENRLPKDKEIPGLLRTLTKIGKRFELKITSISPMTIINASNYNEVPFQISAQGTYHNMANFFAEIGQEPRILSVKDVNYSVFAPSKENANTVSVTFTLVAYTFKG